MGTPHQATAESDCDPLRLKKPLLVLDGLLSCGQGKGEAVSPIVPRAEKGPDDWDDRCHPNGMPRCLKRFYILRGWADRSYLVRTAPHLTVPDSLRSIRPAVPELWEDHRVLGFCPLGLCARVGGRRPEQSLLPDDALVFCCCPGAP